MKALSGNMSDKGSFRKMINEYTKALKPDSSPVCWVADSALYTEETLQLISDKVYWITRVPETLKESKDMIASVNVADMHSFEDKQLSTYRYINVCSAYAGVKQHWMVIFSQQAKLLEYKNQNKVEKGFRFLKDRQFMAATLFVKKTQRLEAILMIMTLCLMVYAALEYELLTKLKEQQQTVPNQSKNRLTTQLCVGFLPFLGVSIVYLLNRNNPLE